MIYYPEPDEYRTLLPQLGFTVEREVEDRRAPFWSFHVTFEGTPYRVLWSGRERRFEIVQWDGQEPEPRFSTAIPAAGPEGSEEFKTLLRSLCADPAAFAATHTQPPFSASPATQAKPKEQQARSKVLPSLVGGVVLLLLWLIFRGDQP
jgi:hypothetical protein